MSKKKKSKKHRQPNVQPAVRLQNQLEQWVNQERLLNENEAIVEFVEQLRERGMDFEEVSAELAKKEILKALSANRREGFRLPRDLVAARSTFFEHILSLPDTAETPSFTREDFDTFAGSGKSVEEARHFEQTVGGVARLPGGEDAFILRGSPEDDF